MKLLLYDLLRVYPALEKIFQFGLDPEVAWEYLSEYKKIKTAKDDYEFFKQNQILKHGKKDGNKTFIPDNDFSAISAVMNELMKLQRTKEIEYSWKPIPLTILKGIKLSMEDIDLLIQYCFIKKENPNGN